MSRRHASQEHASQKTAADGGEAEPRDGRRRFVLGVAGLASGAVAALVGPLAISACLAQAAEPNAACSSTQGEGTVAVAPASSSTDAEAGSAGPGGDAWSTASTFGFDPFAYMVNEVPMGQTAVLSNATDPNAAPDRSTRALGWEGAMEVTVNSATLYQGSFNVDEELGSLNLGYIAQGSPVSLTGGSYALEDWRFLVCEM